MLGAEVGTASADNDASDDAFTAEFSARLFGSVISLMVFLEFALLSFDISIIRHRVTAEVYASLKRTLQNNKHEFELFLGNGFWQR